MVSQKEEKGVMTVRFKDELAAEACIAVSTCVAAFQFQASTMMANASVNRPTALQKMNGRFFAGRTVSAYPMTGKNKFKKSGTELSLEGTGLGDADEDAESQAKEKERLEKYAEWLEKGGE